MSNFKKIRDIINNPYVFSLIAKIINVFGGLIYTVIFSRYFGATLRGEAAIILNYAEILSLILGCGLYQAYPYFKKKEHYNLQQQFINYGFTMIILYSLIVIILSVFIDFTTQTIVIMILTLLFIGVRHFNYLIMVENPKKGNIASVVTIILDIVVLVLLAVFSLSNLYLCYLFLIIKECIGLLILIKSLNVKFIKIRPTLKGIAPYLRYGIIPMIASILMVFNYKVDIIMLQLYNISLSEIGVYSLGVMLAQKLWVIPDAIQQILISQIVKGKDEFEVAKVTRMCFAIILICIFLVVVFGQQIIWLLYGSEYEGAYGVTIVIILGILGMVFYKMVYSYNMVLGRNKINLFLLGGSGLVNILINIIFIPKFGTNGAALASLISFSLCGISFLIYFCKKTKIGIKDMILPKKEDFSMISNTLKK